MSSTPSVSATPSPSPPCTATARGDLLDECVANFPPESEYEDDDERIRVAVIGKPNVGKSSLVNLILGEKRVIVSNMAGTTRDAVDTYFENKYGKYVFNRHRRHPPPQQGGRPD